MTDTPDVPGYRVGALLGRGASAEVWSAVRVGERERRAIKVIRPGADGLDAALREAAVLRRTTHQHVLRVHDVLALSDGDGNVDVDDLDGAPPAGGASLAGAPVPPETAGMTGAAVGVRLALVLELAEGGSLTELVTARGHLSQGELVTALSPVAAAMGDLHRGGVVHADLSPGNILFSADGRPMVADLGVARLAGESPGRSHGTAGFVAPELQDGAVAGPASDVYSLGALAWYCLTGQAPAPRAVREPLVDLAPGTSDTVVDVIDRALSGDPSRRPTADELATTVFDAAPASPLVLSPGLDPAQGITYRIRSGADGAPEPDDRQARRRTRRRRLRRTLAVAAVAGVVLGGGLGVGARWWHAGHGVAAAALATDDTAWTAAEAPDDRPAGGGHPADAATPTAGAGSAGSRSGPVASRPAVDRSTGVEHSAGPAQRRASTTRRGDSADGLLRRRDAARTAPQRVLAVLVAGRARAWREGSPAGLDRALAPGSSALARDREDLTRVKEAGARYVDLRFTVRGVRVRTTSTRTVRLDARVHRSAYRLVRPGRPAGRVPGADTTGAQFELRWTAKGWRIAQWS